MIVFLFSASPKQNVQIKSGQSPFAFDAGKPLGHIFRVNFALDKCLNIVYMFVC
jgi:hypothetical protein